jgi:hypothetical protein
MEFDGIMIIENYPKLKSLNIGNNYLSYLVIRNCPKLRKLRYAHNKLKHDAFIINCPNLKLANIDNHNWDGKIEWDEIGEELFKKGKLKGKEEFNQQQKLNNKVKEFLERIKNNSNIPFQEFLNIAYFVLNYSDENLKEQFKKAFVPRLEKHVQELITNYSETKRSQFLTEINSLTPFLYLLSSETKSELTRILKQERSENINSFQKYLPYLLITTSILLIMILLLIKMFKEFKKFLLIKLSF